MFKKSLYRELGKNTGKWASNKLFGDNWSTPYRFSNANTKLAKEALKIEQELSEKEFENEIELKKYNQLLSESKNYEERKQEIIKMALPNTKEALFEFSNFLLSNIYASGWDNKEENKHRNLFSNACLIKLKQCKVKFQIIESSFGVQYLSKEIRTLKRKRFFEKYGAVIALILIMIICFVLLNITGAM